MKINFIFVGESKEKIFNGPKVEFFSRIKHYYNAEMIFIKPSNKEKETAKREEAKSILNILNKNKSKNESLDFVILLDERGKELNTVEFKNLFEKTLNESYQNIYFIVGGAYGVDDEIKSFVDFTLAISKFVLPHSLAHVNLLEQIYRISTIIKGEKYHHE